MALPKLAVYKFASCDGCQLSILDVEDMLLDIASVVHIANFPEASREVIEGPYDLTLVEGSITTPHDAERIHEIRRQSKFLVTIGACATAGGIQALRNWKDTDLFARTVYAHPEYLDTLETSTPVKNHVEVNFELRGCPVDKMALVEVVAAFVQGRRPNIPEYSVCVECKRKGDTMRNGESRHSVSGTGYSSRLRGAVPVLQPRLLRVLRSDGEPQHGYVGRQILGPRSFQS